MTTDRDKQALSGDEAMLTTSGDEADLGTWPTSFPHALGKIGSIPLKDPKFRKIPPKVWNLENYH